MLFRVYLLGMIQQTEYIETCSHKSYRKKNLIKKKSLFLMLVAFLSDFKH